MDSSDRIMVSLVSDLSHSRALVQKGGDENVETYSFVRVGGDKIFSIMTISGAYKGSICSEIRQPWGSESMLWGKAGDCCFSLLKSRYEKQQRDAGVVQDK